MKPTFGEYIFFCEKSFFGLFSRNKGCIAYYSKKKIGLMAEKSCIYKENRTLKPTFLGLIFLCEKSCLSFFPKKWPYCVIQSHLGGQKAEKPCIYKENRALKKVFFGFFPAIFLQLLYIFRTFFKKRGKSMISTIFTWNRITDKYRYYFYTDLLTDVSLRIRLTNILNSDDNTHLYCGCSSEHDKDIFLSDEGKILFPKGILHSSKFYLDSQNT